jgi:hypothetical protein
MTSRITTPFELAVEKSSSKPGVRGPWVSLAVPPAVFLTVLHWPQTTSLRSSVAALLMAGAFALLIASASCAWRYEGVADEDSVYTAAILAIALSISFGVAVLAVMLPLL